MDPEIAKCFATEKLLLILSGFYLIKPTKHKILFYSSRIINWGLNIFLLVSSMLLMVLEKVDITVMTACWLLSVTQVAFLLKLQFFYLKRYDLQELEDFLSTDESFNVRSVHKTKIINKNFSSCRRMFRMYRTFCTITCTGYALYPFLDKNEGHILTLPGYIPWDFVKYNLLTNLLQSLTIASSAYLNSSLDTLAVALLTLGTVQFEVINENLRTLDYSEPKEIVEHNLRRIIIHHKKTLEFLKKVEELFTYGMFFQFAASVGVICLTGFQLLVIDIYSVQFLMLTSYFLCMMTQVYIFSWFGQLLTFQSDQLIRSSSMGNWYESTPKVRKMLFIFLERCKKPVVMSGAKFFSLSLATYITILKSSYSYFAVLKSVYTKRTIEQ